MYVSITIEISLFFLIHKITLVVKEMYARLQRLPDLWSSRVIPTSILRLILQPQLAFSTLRRG